MKQPLANVLFKLSPQSVIQLRGVTPAELMYLCALHRRNAGGNPVVKLTEIPENHEDSQVKAATEALNKLEKSLADTETDPNLTEEVREKRIRSITERIEARQRDIDHWKSVRSIRTLSPAQERSRLTSKYKEADIKALYPGGIPNLPQSFAEAQSLGKEADLPESKFGNYMVGSEKLAEAATHG